MNNDIQELFTDQIDLPKDNMREHIDREAIYELATDIKKNGLINPITVRPVKDRFELVAGQRRYLAHQVAGIIKIKCMVKALTDDEAFAIMTSENLSRVDVNAVDEAKHVGRLMERNNNLIPKVAQIVNRSESWIRDRLAVASMPDYMQDLLAKKELKLGVALLLNEIDNDDLRRMWTFQAVRDGANIQLAEYWLMDYKRQKLPGGALSDPNANTQTYVAPSVVMLECALDGKKYDARTIRSVFIYENNLELFYEFVKAFRGAPAENDLELGGH